MTYVPLYYPDAPVDLAATASEVLDNLGDYAAPWSWWVYCSWLACRCCECNQVAVIVAAELGGVES